MSAPSSARHAVDSLPIKVFFRDGSHVTVKLGAVSNFNELHRAVVMKVRGLKGQRVLKDSDPLLHFFALYTVTTEAYLEHVWVVKETFKLPTDHIEFARLVFRSVALMPPPPPAFTPHTSRSNRDGSYSDEEFVPKTRSSIGFQPTAIASNKRTSTLGSPVRRARQEVDLLSRIRSDRINTGSLTSLGFSSEEMAGESSDDLIHTPPASPRRSLGPLSPKSSPSRARRCSIGSTSSLVGAIHQMNGTLHQVSPSSPSSSMTSLSPIVTARLDSTLLWADFLEATHLVATSPLFKPKDALDTIQLAALHFYIFSLQSPPSTSTSRREKSKSSGGAKETSDTKTVNTSSSSTGHSVQIEEENDALSKPYRKALHKNIAAFYPARLMTSAIKSTILEESIWNAYVDHVCKKYTVEDAMQEYTKLFNIWRFSGARLFYDVKRDVTALLAPKSFVLAINEDGIFIMKKDKENEIAAHHLFTNIANWSVAGNVLSIEYYMDDSVASGPSGATLSSETSALTSLGSSGSLQVPGSVSVPLSPSIQALTTRPTLTSATATATAMYITHQAETIAAVMQFYLDRLVSLIFDRSEFLRVEPSPRIMLLTSFGTNEPATARTAHKIAVESLIPSLAQLRTERTDRFEIGSTSSGASDSERDIISHSTSVEALSTSSSSIKRTSGSSVTTTNISTAVPSLSPHLSRLRSPSLPKSQLDSSKMEQQKLGDLNEGEGVTPENGPRRRTAKTKRPNGVPSLKTVTNSKLSDAESRGSESDRERMSNSASIWNEGSETEIPSRPTSPYPPSLDSSTGPSTLRYWMSIASSTLESSTATLNEVRLSENQDQILELKKNNDTLPFEGRYRRIRRLEQWDNELETQEAELLKRASTLGLSFIASPQSQYASSNSKRSDQLQKYAATGHNSFSTIAEEQSREESGPEVSQSHPSRSEADMIVDEAHGAETYSWPTKTDHEPELPPPEATNTPPCTPH